MRDYIRRLLIAGMIAICISLLFLGGKSPKAETVGETEHWIWPANGEITDTYGTRNGMHKGIDIAGELNTPIYAVDDGVVTKSYYSDTYGHVVFIKHQNNYETVYAHLHKRAVQEGEEVRQGSLVGKMGNTGDSSGVHLHFEIHQVEWTYSKENAINPDYALGLTEVGQAVIAHSTANPGEAIETSNQPDSKNVLQVLDTGGTDQQGATFTASGKGMHKVVRGETLWSIAQKYNLTVESIIQLNQLDSQKVKVGQALVIEQQDEAKKHYIVSKGDTLSSISRATGVSVNQIKEKNKLNSNIIHPKQILVIQ